MKIIRNGQEFELTTIEMMQIHNEYEESCLIEDIESKISDLFPDKEELSRSELKLLARNVSHALNNNDSYWDSFWFSIDYVINDYFNQKGC